METITDWLADLQGWATAREVLRLDLLGELLLATLLGGVVGWEREISGKPAGLRTNILICVGAALLTDLSIGFAGITGVGGAGADPARITAQIVSGIGFLGAGTILQARGTVTGLTSAATLWVVAAIGMTVGAGGYIEATGTALLVVAVLWPLGWVESRIEESRHGRTIRVALTEAGKEDEVQRMLEEAGLKVIQESLVKEREGEIQVTLEVLGPTSVFRRVRAEIHRLPHVRAIFRA